MPQIAKQFQNKSAMYYIVKGNRLSNNLKHILTIDFKETNEELIHGEDILEEAGGDIKELDIKTIISYINKYLQGIGAKTQDIDTIQKEFIKQSFYNRFVKQSDENNHNWGILVNNQENRARIAPIYDLDCCCEVGTLRKNVRTTSDGSKYNIEGFFKDFGQYRWFNMYTKEIIEDFDINKAIKNRPANVIMPGYIKGDIIKGAMQCSTCLLFPSYEETEGIVVLEAFASGLPVVVRDIGVYKDWLTDKVNCRKAIDNDGFVDCINDIINGDNTKMIANGYEIAKERSIDKIGNQLKAAYEQTIELNKKR